MSYPAVPKRLARALMRMKARALRGLTSAGSRLAARDDPLARLLLRAGRFLLTDARRRRRRYARWVDRYDTLSREDRVAIERHVRVLAGRPLISIVVPVHNTPERWLRRCLDSVLAQQYPEWQLCVADDASTAAHVRRVLASYQAADPRVSVAFRDRNGHICAASNSALELARGEFIALLDHDDELAPHALYMVAVELAEHPGADVIYSDEDKIDDAGRRYDPYFKPDWNPELFLAQNYLSHLGVYRAARVREVGAFRQGYEGCQDWDLALRITEGAVPGAVRHIPHVLYHWRSHGASTARAVAAKDYVREAGRRALQSHFERRGERAAITPAVGGYWRVTYPLPEPPPRVSVIIPTRDGAGRLRRCLDSLREKTDYPDWEVIVVDNGSSDNATRDYLAALAQRRDTTVLDRPGPFNFSALCNHAAAAAAGDLLAFLNDDVTLISGDWLREMGAVAWRAETGLVGAMLYYPDDTIQHAGIVVGAHGIAAHSYSRKCRGHGGQFGRARLRQNVSAVTAACCVVRRALFNELGGFDAAHLGIAYNDVDLCLRAMERGYRNVWTPYAELYHVESASRGSDDAAGRRERFAREQCFMRERWAGILAGDPAYSPNLALDGEPFTLAAPPRARKPWRGAGDAAGETGLAP